MKFRRSLNIKLCNEVPYVNTTESLETAVLSGTYTISGSIASHGLFDTGPTALPLTFRESDAGSGAISFVAIPEPNAAIYLGLFLSIIVGFKRRPTLNRG